MFPQNHTDGALLCLAGSSLGCFHWSQGVKLRASVRLLLEWLRGAGFEQLAQQFFAKLASVANLLAMPGSQLLQVSWGGSCGRDALGRGRCDATRPLPAVSLPR